MDSGYDRWNFRGKIFMNQCGTKVCDSLALAREEAGFSGSVRLPSAPFPFVLLTRGGQDGDCYDYGARSMWSRKLRRTPVLTRGFRLLAFSWAHAEARGSRCSDSASFILSSSAHAHQCCPNPASLAMLAIRGKREEGRIGLTRISF